MYEEILPSGKIRFGESFENPMTGKRQKVSVTMPDNSRKSRLLAQKKLDEKMEKALGGTFRQDTITLEELIEAYRNDQRLTVAESTYRRNFHQCNSFIRYMGGSTLVSRLNAGFVRNSFKDCSPTTFNEHMTRFKALMRWAYKNDYIMDIRWLDKLDRVPDREKRSRLADKYLEPEEIAQLLEGMNHTQWKNLTEFLLLSGLRCGEALALDVEDVTDSYISITKTLDSQSRKVTPPKTDCSNREVYIQKELRECINRQLQYKSVILVGRRNNHLFFNERNGGYTSLYAYDKYLKENSESILHRSITSHVCRHTHVSILASQGVPLETISRRLGHENSRVTREIYLHVTKAQVLRDNRYIDSMGNILSNEDEKMVSMGNLWEIYGKKYETF